MVQCGPQITYAILKNIIFNTEKYRDRGSGLVDDNLLDHTT